jgi:hypothetical protein
MFGVAVWITLVHHNIHALYIHKSFTIEIIVRKTIETLAGLKLRCDESKLLSYMHVRELS